MKRIMSLALLCVLVLVVFPGNTFAAYTVLHEFSGSTTGGHLPVGALVSEDSVLYGMTESGGGYNRGAIFKMSTIGSGFELLHEFQGGEGDGDYPHDSLLREGSVLYGMTALGGDSDSGVIFKINTDGSGFELLHEFAGAPDDGYWPLGSLTLSGSTLFGMASAGGEHDLGVIFKVNTDGTGFELLYEFGGPGDGSTPTGSLLLAGSALYGMTRLGGASDLGVIFKINTDGTGFQFLHEFTGGADDGARPYCSLLSDGSTLYGMTYNGGPSDYGVIFKINTDGSGFELLHEFTGGPDDGGWPRGSLLMSDSTLYGMTQAGGAAGFAGIIFKTNTDGSGFRLLHRFAGAPEDGSSPHGSLLMRGSTFYGMTTYGGAVNAGIIFSLDLFDSNTRPIPTLNEWGVLILAVLLATAAMALMKRRTNYTSTRSRC